MGIICYGCHNFRNKIKASVKNRLSERELELEMIKAHNTLIETGQVIDVKREKIVGWLCKKCSIKATNAVRERPFGMGWRQAFSWRDNPKAIQTWKDQRLETSIRTEREKVHG